MTRTGDLDFDLSNLGGEVETEAGIRLFSGVKEGSERASEGW